MKSKKLTIGILAHVDAGKTTLSETLLYNTGTIAKIGRVDHKDAFLDTDEMEKDRGITIFSKQAMFNLGEFAVTLLDTPGHVDFSAEMERTLSVLDYAILVINGTDGVQGHTRTVWQLLNMYHIPTFIFVNKMDLHSPGQEQLLSNLKASLDTNMVNFQAEADILWDDLATCDAFIMDQYLEENKVDQQAIKDAIYRRHVFPVYFGSALKNEGVADFIKGLKQYLESKSYPSTFGARVYNISRTEQGERLTHVKITGGAINVKDIVHYKDQTDLGQDGEKIDQIRLYSGSQFEVVQTVGAGSVCALTGLLSSKVGDGLGFEQKANPATLTPVLSYKLILPESTNSFDMLKNMRLLEEEEPHLKVVWLEEHKEIHLQVMGEIQLEILKRTIERRFSVDIEFGEGSLVYKETIREPVIGRGHFEPLRHYAEVHLLLEPLPSGSGIVVDRQCSEDVMDKQHQRLVLSHLKEKDHIGVLSGSVIEDMKITLVAGRGHKKHTVGGDFREATFRALRQGLMKASSVLLEPMYQFVLEVPNEYLGRVLADMDKLNATYDDPIMAQDVTILKGVAPVSLMMPYNREVISYTRGQGRLSLTLKGYEPCHNEKDVLDKLAYDPDNDTMNPSGSVFCSKGSGYGVSWDKSDQHMHVESYIKTTKESNQLSKPKNINYQSRTGQSIDDKELERIFSKTYGERKDSLAGKSSVFRSQNSSSNKHIKSITKDEKEHYLLVDGYNIIFAWESLKDLAEDNLDGARYQLMERLSDYQGQTDYKIILVFDAYRVTGNRGNSFSYHNIQVVYTKEAETADQYIERLVHEIRPDYEVTVATSDVVEQVIILGRGARRLSADHFEVEVASTLNQGKQYHKQDTYGTKNRPFDGLIDDVKPE